MSGRIEPKRRKTKEEEGLMSIFKKNWKEDKAEDEWKQIIPPPNDIPPVEG